ncbi:Intermembrane phospholipid transport system lipoprotein MlaA [Candidatus Erwinia haradaeae]|uniref:Intermembrane phospholipid transport system lipoprotein MlaA n=1 Tax=Candidatus Erwinia haradaeae TaxID=1922217 RepID=A0A451DK21_9GAMM|nr:MlaA family lipoprotein [Candidatus Erwinia haradaeae]VFP87046.1 Intermembrane phospholipid transport system lipoprotein MlaA [Candidatus Erwinia haradaeae]
MSYQITILVFAGIFLTGCMSAPVKSEIPVEHQDPLEGINRTIFNWNYSILDPYIMRPLALLWRDTLPIPIRHGLNNVTSNLSEPSSIVNYLLEGNPYKAGLHFSRLLLNTLLGMGGLIDLASMANVELAKEEHRTFGNTLGHYEVCYGTYIVIPIYGGFTPREDLGKLVDYFYLPYSWFTWWMSAGQWFVEGIETRAQLLDYDDITREVKDPYVFMREAYFQYHDFLAKDVSLAPKDHLDESVMQNIMSEIDS